MYKLRELEKKDLPIINHWRNDKSLIDCLGAPYRFINLEVDENWYASYMNNRSSTVRCAITGDDGDEILGLVSLTNINSQNQSCVFHIMIGENKNRDRGLGTFAVNAMLHHAFNNMNLHRVELSVLACNSRAIHLYEKCGFVKEGCKRKCAYKNGEFVDMYTYSILKEEFAKSNSGGGIVPVYPINFAVFVNSHLNSRMYLNGDFIGISLKKAC